MRHRLSILSFAVLLACSAVAQDSLRQHAIENVLTVGFGGVFVTDEYLSALPYKGYSIHIDNEWWQSFRRNADWSHVGELRLTGALLGNNVGSNSLLGFGARGGWGAHYGYKPIADLTIMAGGVADVDYYGRVITKSVNKPYSMDLALALNLSAGVEYRIAANRSAYRLRYMVRTPFVGCMFAPEMGQSYYEMESSLRGTAHFASFHNRVAMVQALTLDMRFRRSTWRIGVAHDFLRVKTESLTFSREQVRLVIGAVFDKCIFGGKNRPENLETVW